MARPLDVVLTDPPLGDGGRRAGGADSSSVVFSFCSFSCPKVVVVAAAAAVVVGVIVVAAVVDEVVARTGLVAVDDACSVVVFLSLMRSIMEVIRVGAANCRTMLASSSMSKPLRAATSLSWWC